MMYQAQIKISLHLHDYRQCILSIPGEIPLRQINASGVRVYAKHRLLHGLLFSSKDILFGNMSCNLFLTQCSVLGKPPGKGPVDIHIENGRISRIGPGLHAPPGCKTIDTSDKWISPGFIDIHIQGAGGADILDGTPDSLQTISRSCAAYGVTGFLATTVFKPDRENSHLKLAADSVGTDLGGAELLGIHLEGPFISTEKRGMIQPDSLTLPSPQVLDRILTLTSETLRIMTIAPEIEGNLDLIRRLTESRIVASFGHSNATFEQTKAGIDMGISHVTHLYNAMRTMHHRDPGPLPALLTSECSAQIIPDGVHVHPALIHLSCSVLGSSRIVTITDGMHAMGLGNGKYVYDGVSYISENGAARYRDGTLIGTAMGMNEVLARLMEYGGLSLDETVNTATVGPAEVLKMSTRKGSIESGKDGDITILNKDFSVSTTIVKGRVVYNR
jgi:N-acetylglucosamine-6-phosphate deacetylase